MYDISIYISTIILYFTWATAGLEGERDAVSRKIVGSGVGLDAAQCREHHHDCMTSGQYVLFQHPIILSLDYDGHIWNSKVKYMDFEKLKK